MSNSSDPWHPGVAADIEATYSTLFLPQLSYIEFGCLMLVIYEYLLTFSTEYYQIWCRKWTIPSVLYLVNRYTLYLLVPTTWFADYMAPDSSTCSIAQGFHLTFVFILGTVTTVFMVLRVHAINTGNGQWFWTVLLILMTLIAIPFIMFEWTTAHWVSLHALPFLGCLDNNIEAGLWQKYTIAGYSIGLVGTTIVAGITLYRTAASALAARKANLPNSLSYYLLRDGTTYYLFDLLLYSVSLYLQKVGMTLGTTYTIMASIVMSRFILNLRTIHSQDLSLPTLSSGARSIDSLRFAPPSPLDNIGAPLDVEDYNVREFEDEVYEVHNGDGDHVADPSDATDGSGISDKCRVEEREEGDGLAIV